MIRRATNDQEQGLLEDDHEFADSAEDIGLALEDMANNLNAIETIVVEILCRTEMWTTGELIEIPSKSCRNLTHFRISLVRTFSRQLTVDLPRSIDRLKKLVSKDPAQHRIIKKYDSEIDALEIKWNKNKYEYETNANVKKAVVIQNSLG